MVSKFEKFTQRLLIQPRQVIAVTLHQFDQDRERQVLFHINTHQDQPRQIIHTLTVAHCGVVLAVGN